MADSPFPQPLGARAQSKDPASFGWRLHVLRRHQRLALIVLVLVMSVAAGFLVVVAPIYEARVKLLIEPESPNVVAFKEVVEQNGSNLDYYETQLGILRSRSVARKTIDVLGLWRVPELCGRWEVIFSPPVSEWLSSVRTPLCDGNEMAMRSRATDALLSRLTLIHRVDNRLADVLVRSVDPERAADIANTLADVFTADTIATKLHAAKEASAWLRARLAEQTVRVETSEAALQAYRERNPDLSFIEQENVAAQKLSNLSGAATRAQAERIEAESLYEQLGAIHANPAASDTIPVMLSNPYIQELKSQLATLQREEIATAQRLGDRHPEMIRLRSGIQRARAQLDAEVAMITESARNQRDAALIKERSLATALEAQKQQSLNINRAAIEYASLQRDGASNRQIFEGLLQRTKEAELSSALNTTNIRVIDYAEIPQFPVFPRRGLVMLLALLIGAPLAFGAAMAREYWDDRIQSPRDITMGLGVRFLGHATTISQKAMAAGERLSRNNSATAGLGGACRSARSDLQTSTGRHARLLLVTSASRVEGRTPVASSLAVVLAQSGHRVLLVDADMRRAQIHTIFAAPQEPGLADVLQETTSISTAIRPTSIAGLLILTAGATLTAPADLLQRDGFARAMASVRDRFDWIVIDSPPVMFGSEAIALARVSRAVMFVVAAQMTRARDARAALEQLTPSGAAIVGAVLSCAGGDRLPSYSYDRYREYQRTH